MNIFESSEDYLERILMLSKTQPEIFAVNIAHSMGFSKPSVSIALKKLKERGLIEVSSKGAITLTEDGLTIASKIYGRHTHLKSILMSLGVSEHNAEEDACKIEHDLSEETYQAILKHFAQK